MRMLIATELSAGPLEWVPWSGNAIGLEPHMIGMAWNHICLAGELWYPEAVNHIIRNQIEMHRRPHWHYQLIGCDNERFGLIISGVGVIGAGIVQRISLVIII